MNKALSASYFRDILDIETRKLEALCKEWEDVLSKVGDNEVLDEERSGEIRAAIGLAHLLINQRFKQFSGLIKDCEEEKTPKVTPEDLQGFWDMVYFQVQDIHSKFQQLSSLKAELPA